MRAQGRRPTKRERCEMGKHTPISPDSTDGSGILRAQCRYCGRPIMRTFATRCWFLAAMLSDDGDRGASGHCGVVGR